MSTVVPTTHPKSVELTLRSFVSGREVMAMIELGADHVTLGVPMLEDLSHAQ